MQHILLNRLSYNLRFSQFETYQNHRLNCLHKLIEISISSTGWGGWDRTTDDRFKADCLYLLATPQNKNLITENNFQWSLHLESNQARIAYETITIIGCCSGTWVEVRESNPPIMRSQHTVLIDSPTPTYLVGADRVAQPGYLNNWVTVSPATIYGINSQLWYILSYIYLIFKIIFKMIYYII